MIKQYIFDYDSGKGEASLIIDTDKFTKEIALTTLNFSFWDWDEDADPIDEVAKKYALEAIKQATYNDHNTYGVKSDFNNLEDFVEVDGSSGIELTHVEGFMFNEEDLSLKLKLCVDSLYL